MKSAEHFRAQGFTIDECCYPWVAYKGPRFRPDEWHSCLTNKEAALIEALAELVESHFDANAQRANAALERARDILRAAKE